MAEETDGIQEALEGQLRVLLTAAGQLGERVARAREEALRRSQAASEQEGRELTSRLAAERAAARAQLTPVYRAEWWDRAGAEDIARAYITARAWNDEDPEAHRAEQRIRDEVRTRYGIDVDAAGADPAAVRDHLARGEAVRRQAGQEPHPPREDSVEAQLLMMDAERADRAAPMGRAGADDGFADRENEIRGEASREAQRDLEVTGRSFDSQEERDAFYEREPEMARRVQGAAQDERGDVARAQGRATYDSPERREAFASELERVGVDREIVATRVRADVSQAAPATEATRTVTKKSPKARKGRAGRGQWVQRTGLDR